MPRCRQRRAFDRHCAFRLRYARLPISIRQLLTNISLPIADYDFAYFRRIFRYARPRHYDYRIATIAIEFYFISMACARRRRLRQLATIRAAEAKYFIFTPRPLRFDAIQPTADCDNDAEPTNINSRQPHTVISDDAQLYCQARLKKAG